MTNTEYLTIRQVAERLGFHRNTVEAWLRSGKLKGYKFGRSWRVLTVDLDRMGHRDIN